MIILLGDHKSFDDFLKGTLSNASQNRLPSVILRITLILTL